MVFNICKRTAILLSVVLLALSIPSFAATTERVSVSSTGAQAGNFTGDGSYNPCSQVSCSADGRYVVFTTWSADLAPGLYNEWSDIVIRDRVSGTTELVNATPTGQSANGHSGNAHISADGRYVVFISAASNLVPEDTNGDFDIFVRDLTTDTTELVTLSSTGEQRNDSIGAGIAISADGRYIAFSSLASNLVPGDTNGKYDVFVRDRIAGTTKRVSIGTYDAQGNGDSDLPSISADGRYVAFISTASGLVDGDTNNASDVFVRDMVAGTTTRVSVSSTGAQASAWNYAPAISANGRFVAFCSASRTLTDHDTNCLDIFVKDLTTGSVDMASISTYGYNGDGDSYGQPAISADGRFVAFVSRASNLISGDTNGRSDVFIRDRLTSITERVSVSTSGMQTTSDNSYPPDISADGRYVVFSSTARFLVSGDTNGREDVFVRDRIAPPTNISITPNSGNIMVDQSTKLSSVYSDSLGYSNLKTCYLLINNTLTTTNSGYFFYDVLKNKLYLRKPDQAVLIGGYAPGKAQVIDNGFMTLNCAQTSVQKSGNTLTINWNITLKPYFKGMTCDTWMMVTNKADKVDLWEQMGEFNVIPNPSPFNVSLTPGNGVITINQKTTLSSLYSDPAGFENIKSCYLSMNPGSSTSGTGYFFYDAAKNKLYLRRPYDSVLIGGYTPGSDQVINNGCIVLYCADTNIQKSGNDMTINWSIALKPYFAGSSCTASMQVTNKTGYSDPMEQMGLFSVN